MIKLLKDKHRVLNIAINRLKPLYDNIRYVSFYKHDNKALTHYISTLFVTEWNVVQKQYPFQVSIDVNPLY